MKGKTDTRLATREIDECIIIFETSCDWHSKVDKTKSTQLGKYGKDRVITRYYAMGQASYSIKVNIDTLHVEFYYKKDPSDAKLSLFASEKFSLGDNELSRILVKNSLLMVPNHLSGFPSDTDPAGKNDNLSKYLNDAVIACS